MNQASVTGACDVERVLWPLSSALVVFTLMGVLRCLPRALPVPLQFPLEESICLCSLMGRTLCLTQTLLSLLSISGEATVDNDNWFSHPCIKCHRFRVMAATMKAYQILLGAYIWEGRVPNTPFP